MPKIEDYALLGDLHTAALVSTAGSVDWLCLPRFDSPAAFAALVHSDEAGHWSLAPAGADHCTTRRYAGDTLVLETDWVSADGAVRVIDFMPPRVDTPHLVRIAVGLRGAVPMRSVLRLRLDYGGVVPWVRHLGTQVHAVAGPDRVRLMSGVPLRGDHRETRADFTVRAGDRIPFVMSWAPGQDPELPHADAEQALAATTEFWTQWCGRADYPAGPYREPVDRSVTILKALIHEPTGGIVAAPTTSLLEELGGVRNWDYRYCWLRDATYTLQALLAAGFRSEASAWRDWLLRSIAGQPEELQILYSLDGGRRLPEAELPWLSGYEGSRPVRTGNAASGQLQLDVWGETLDALFLARQAGLPADEDAWALQVTLMEHLETAWREPDNGLWEVRGDRQHFTHSNVMAWAAADRMARSVRTYGLPGPAARWERLRDHIHHEVITHAFDAGRNTFTQAYGSAALDASLLLIPRVGFLPGTDPRVQGTIDAIRRELSEGGWSSATRPPKPTTGSRGAKACSSPARSGWSTRCTRRDGRKRRSTCSNACSGRETTSACSARNGTRPRGASSATPPRRSATSPWWSAPSSCTWSTRSAATTRWRYDGGSEGTDRPGRPDRVQPGPGRRGLCPDVRMPRRTAG